MPALVNLVVDLDTLSAFPLTEHDANVSSPAAADERTLAWIDQTFSATWGCEAALGATLLVRDGETPAGFATIDARGLTFRWLTGLGHARDVGLFGPFGVIPARRKSGIGVALLRRALAELSARGYARALIPAVSGASLIDYYRDAVGARVAETFDRDALLAPRPRTVVMASGNGTNLQAVLDASTAGALPIDVVAVVSNNSRAFALQRARDAGVPEVRALVWNRANETRAQYDARLLDEVRAQQADLVLLLGWMHLLSGPFVRSFENVLNLHPAYLPLDPAEDSVVMPDGTRTAAFRGPHAVRDALACKSPWIGATVHRVTPATDRGPVLARKPLRVLPGEEEAELMERLHREEHALVQTAVTRWLFERPLNGDRKERLE
ncbi:MAG TPA: GNAT family N-acetyltransferase [Candidatus Cybelea sp.]|nr:GNAT family N-acetyltransferase [Candidatus Cybelea sp.]